MAGGAWPSWFGDVCCSSPCLIWGSELLPLQGSTGAWGQSLPGAGRTKVTLEIKFCSIEGILLWGWRNTMAASAQPWHLGFLAKNSSWRQRGRVPAMPTSTSEGMRTQQSPKPLKCAQINDKNQLLELCTSLVAVLAVTAAPKLGSQYLGYNPCLLQSMSRWFFMCVSSSDCATLLKTFGNGVVMHELCSCSNKVSWTLPILKSFYSGKQRC